MKSIFAVIAAGLAGAGFRSLFENGRDSFLALTYTGG
jgi:hypothetical protein